MTGIHPEAASKSWNSKRWQRWEEAEYTDLMGQCGKSGAKLDFWAGYVLNLGEGRQRPLKLGVKGVGQRAGT